MKLPQLGAVMLAIIALSTPSVAAGLSYDLTVAAGAHHRSNTPVRVLLRESQTQANRNPKLLAEARSVVLTDSSGAQIPAQLTEPGLLDQPKTSNSQVVRRLDFILPSLGQGESLELTAVLSDRAPSGDGYSWKDTPGDNTLLSHGVRPVLRYICGPIDESSPQARTETYKVFHHLYNPAGTRPVTKGPGGLYTHHRGLFFGFNRISYGDGARVDTWHCSGQAHLSHEGILAAEAGEVLGRHCVAVDWHGREAVVFAKELREMTVYNLPGGQLVEFASRLSTTVGPVKLDGDPQHAGFQFRAAQEVAEGDQKLTYYLRPDGRGEPGDTRNWAAGSPRADCVNLPWNAMSFVIDDVRYTAVYLDHPANPKEARYSERTYGRFGSYFEYELDDDRPLELNYRVWLQQGEMTQEEAAALCDDFVQPVQVTVR